MGGVVILVVGWDGIGGGDIEWCWSGCLCRLLLCKVGIGFLWVFGGGWGGRGGGVEDYCKLFVELMVCDDVLSDVFGKGEGDCEGIFVDGFGSW